MMVSTTFVPVSRKVEQTAAPQRNFTLTTAERVNAIVTGVPAWARRLKRIEDLTDEIATSDRPRHELERKLIVLHELIDAHNMYYPIEANLPIDGLTGRLMDRGKPWVRMTKPTLETLRAK
jgi:hypothetical protein